MAQICPHCTADTEPLEEETDRFCIHEKLSAVAILFFIIGFGAGIGL